MVNLDKKNDIEKYSEKKSYSHPKLKEIGKINHVTKGGDKADNPLDVFTGQSIIFDS